jgi:hypothetical protein
MTEPIVSGRSAPRAAFAAVLVFVTGGTLATNADAQPTLGPAYAVTRDLRIDGNAENLSPIGRIAVSATGSILVPQVADYRLVVFDSTGKRTAAMGRRGDGPGDFTGAGPGLRTESVGWSGDSVWAFDRRNVSVFSADGRFLTRAPLATPGSTTSPLIVRARFGDGSAVYRWPPEPGGPSLTPRGAPPAIVRAGPPLVGSKAILRLPADQAVVAVMGSTLPLPDAVATPSMWTASGRAERIAVLTVMPIDRKTGKIRVAMFDAVGDSVFARELPFVGVEMPAFLADTMVALTKRAFAQRPAVADSVERQARDRIPGFLPPVRRLFVAQNGTAWVELRSVQQGRPYLVLSASGAPTGHVIVPHNVTLWDASADRAWGVEKDTDDVEHVVRYRLTPPR